MKRKHSAKSNEGSNKRAKLSSDAARTDLFDPKNRRYIAAILRDENVTEKTGYIFGSICMVYPYKAHEKRLVLSTENSAVGNDNDMVRVEIEFGNKCAERLRRGEIEFSPSQDLFISLQGCSLDPSRLSNGSIARIKFSEKVMFKLASRGQQDLVIDHWGRKSLLVSTLLD